MWASLWTRSSIILIGLNFVLLIACEGASSEEYNEELKLIKRRSTWEINEHVGHSLRTKEGTNDIAYDDVNQKSGESLNNYEVIRSKRDSSHSDDKKKEPGTSEKNGKSDGKKKEPDTSEKNGKSEDVGGKETSDTEKENVATSSSNEGNTENEGKNEESGKIEEETEESKTEKGNEGKSKENRENENKKEESVSSGDKNEKSNSVDNKVTSSAGSDQENQSEGGRENTESEGKKKESNNKNGNDKSVHQKVASKVTSHGRNIIENKKNDTKENKEVKEVKEEKLPKEKSTNGNETQKEKDENCVTPAIEQFPRPLMSQDARKHGGLIIHIIVAVYTFLGLAIVCDDYFVSSLEIICEELKLTPDVAGATFMAAGSSAPELATVVIGVFFAKDDIGVSGVIGSAVFNIMFVISLCALCAKTVSYLNWWPLIRDCCFYSVSILLMLVTIYDGEVEWIEALLMLLVYVVYCYTLHHNAALERWAQTLPVPCKHPPQEEQTVLVTYKTLGGQQQPQQEQQRITTYTTSPTDMDKNIGMNAEQQGMQQNDFMNNYMAPQTEQPQYQQQMPDPQQYQQQMPVPPQAVPQQPAIPPPIGSAEYYKAREGNTLEVSPLMMPIDGGMVAKVIWAIVLPIHALCIATMPNPKEEKWRRWYIFTFFVSMVWISFYSYIMVWMITIIGSTLGIPDTIMGLTFVAAGVSVPDALSSLAVVKEGYGDMAVSNAVGSNVFDILVCLGLPWFLKTAIFSPGTTVSVFSKGLTYSTLSLLSTVVFLIVTTHLNGWKLDKKYGYILMGWYLFFITFASLYELNVFGHMNPLECATDY